MDSQLIKVKKKLNILELLFVNEQVEGNLFLIEISTINALVLLKIILTTNLCYPTANFEYFYKCFLGNLFMWYSRIIKVFIRNVFGLLAISEYLVIHLCCYKTINLKGGKITVLLEMCGIKI